MNYPLFCAPGGAEKQKDQSSPRKPFFLPLCHADFSLTQGVGDGISLHLHAPFRGQKDDFKTRNRLDWTAIYYNYNGYLGPTPLSRPPFFQDLRNRLLNLANFEGIGYFQCKKRRTYYAESRFDP